MLANRNQCAHTRSVALAPDQNEKGGTQAVDAIGFRTSIAISDGVFMNTEYDMAVSFGELHDGLKKSKRIDSGKISMRDVRDNYRSWKANAKRGNTRSLVLKMDEYYRELFKEGAP